MVRPQAYELSPALSQSDITLFEKNIIKFHHEVILREPRDDKKSDALDLGSLIDAILLDPDALSNYYVMAQYKASGKEKEVVDLVWTQLVKDEIPLGKIKTLSTYIPIVEKAIEDIKYQPKWKPETRVMKIVDNGSEYFEQLKEAGGKVIVSMDMWNLAHSTVDGILEDFSTGPTFKMLKGDDCPEYIVVHKSADLYGTDTATGKEKKGLLDFFIEDTRSKVIAPWDLKSAKSHAQFLQNYRMSRYGRQGAFYTALLKENFPKYKILPFQFLVVPTQSGERPEIYIMSESELIVNTDGGEHNMGYRIKGYKELMAEISWHENEGAWDHRKEYYETGCNLIKGNSNVDPGLLVEEEGFVF